MPERAPVATLGDLNAEVWSAAFSPDGQTLVWGGKSRDILGSSPPGTPSRVLNAEVGATWAVAFAPDGSTYATAGYYTLGAVKVWDARSHRLLFDLKGHAGQVRSLHYAPDGRTLASGGYDRTVRLWDLASRTERATLPAHVMPVNAVRFFPDGAAHRRRHRRLAGSREARQPGDLGPRLRIAPDGRRAPVRGEGGRGLGRRRDGRLGRGRRAPRLGREDRPPRPSPWPSDPSVHALEFSPDGRYLATGHYQGEVVVWEAATFRPVAVLKGHRGLVFSLGFSPDGRALASCGRDKTMRLWSLPAPPDAVRGR